MPSVLLSQASGTPFQLFSGTLYSGQGYKVPVGGFQLRLDKTSSGNAYIGLSGAMTINSGNIIGTSGGEQDGMPLFPGDSMFIPRSAFGASGQFSIFVACDAACSGQARLYILPF